MLRRPLAAFSVPVNELIFEAESAERVVTGHQHLRHSGHHDQGVMSRDPHVPVIKFRASNLLLTHYESLFSTNPILKAAAKASTISPPRYAPKLKRSITQPPIRGVMNIPV